VLVVVGIIAGFTGVQVTTIVNNTRIKVDSMNLDTLNSLTEDYAYYNNISETDIFDGYTTDEDRMTALVSEGVLSRIVIPQQNGASFEWDVPSQSWQLIGGEYLSLGGMSNASLNFTSTTITALEDDGTVSIDMSDWDITEDGLENTTGETRLFIPVGQNTYSITSTASLSEGSWGGYGVFFDTIFQNDNVDRDEGYVLQFDRGYGDGAIIVRPREGGSERSPIWTLRANDSELIPGKS
jgi:hypothetical protein